ncbi:TrmJ/YjtD family RNA methyltransferase [Aromatoleum toluvorans]|uniref:tRNA (cytidine/uridine-2'-O-)-methyltransferase TrmJ n=1 Tax=Aromatoleum toluvorans TaxID=92002 RepID=A0ABX1PZW6_9RHOO|nr:RNA methyltransferase [Aromatoleum toluvorans]NMG44190.1 TrmJ/YjtD family RNA methyltransferase [Aromatoleum toluvorans]
MNGAIALDRIRIVLSRTSHPGNIGAAARAMKTMGLSRLWLVEPSSFPDPVADARASGAGDLLAAARVVGSLEEALEGTILSAAVTARRRERSVPVRNAREAAPELVSFAGKGEVALVFGNETSGLTNDEVGLCSMPVTIPANPAFSSLNLGAAVQLLCYELRMTALDPVPPAEPLPDLAPFEDVEGFHRHLERAMTASGFYDPANPKRLLQRLRRLFGRVRLEKEEVNILRGIISAFERKAD